MDLSPLSAGYVSLNDAAPVTMYSYPGPVMSDPSLFVSTGKCAVAVVLLNAARSFSQPLNTIV